MSVSEGLSVTLKTLTTTRNEAAVDMLVRGLSSSNPAVREGCLASCMDRKSPLAHLEVLRRLDQLDAESFDTLASKSGRISQALRQAVLDPDETMCANGCKMAMVMHEFDLIPLLANGVQNTSSQHRDLLAATLRDLSALLYEELADPTESMRNRHDRRDPQLMREHITGPLETAIQDFGRHRREEIVEAFLLIARPGNTTLSAVLADPFHAAYLTIVDQLLHSPSHGVIGLLLNYLEESSPPSSALAALGKRTDIEFLQHLFRRIDGRVSKNRAANLRRIDEIAWVHDPAETIDALDDGQQRAAIDVLMASRVRRLDVFRAIAYTLANGKTGGRRAAALALAEFNGAEANNLAMMALDDEDSEVQATMISQVRARGIPGVLGRLLDFTDSPHDNVRDAIRETLDEFNFERFFASFDKLDDHIRATTATLVRKIDNRSTDLLAHELESPSPARRLRAVSVAGLMGLINEVEELIVVLIDDTDHRVRIEVARALAVSTTNEAVQALAEARNDSSDLVREAAEDSLLQISELRAQAAELARDAANEVAKANEAAAATAAVDTTPVSTIPTIPPPPVSEEVVGD